MKIITCYRYRDVNYDYDFYVQETEYKRDSMVTD